LPAQSTTKGMSSHATDLAVYVESSSSSSTYPVLKNSVSLALSQTPVYTAKPWIQHHVLCVQLSLILIAKIIVIVTYPQRNGQAELTWVALCGNNSPALPHSSQ